MLVDANVFMYAAGVQHPHKEPSISFLSKASRGEINVAVDAEVLQEILHRYRATGRWEQGRQVYDSARRIVPVVIPVTERVVDSARQLLDCQVGLGARDSLHAAVYHMQRADSWCSYDHDFDQIPGLLRKEPGDYLAS